MKRQKQIEIIAQCNQSCKLFVTILFTAVLLVVFTLLLAFKAKNPLDLNGPSQTISANGAEDLVVLGFLCICMRDKFMPSHSPSLGGVWGGH